MALKITPHILKLKNFQVQALSFYYPKAEAQNNKNYRAIFTHGYTASKSDQLSWATRLAEAGIPTLIFDLPGHYLSCLNDVASFEEFTDYAHELFFIGHQTLQEDLEGAQCQQIILGGHSLGGLLACLALRSQNFSNFQKLAIAVGFGMTDDDKTHLFATKFYEKTLNIRRQLVCPALDSDNMFPWIKREKENLNLTNQRIHLITGLDDVVVGQMGMERFVEKLKQQGNTVSFEKPSKLPHHQPELAAAHIYSFLKKEFNLS